MFRVCDSDQIEVEPEVLVLFVVDRRLLLYGPFYVNKWLQCIRVVVADRAISS